MRFTTLLALSIIGACCAPAAAPVTATSHSRTFAKRLEGVENLARINEFLYRGAQPDAAGFARLRELGIKTVISLRSHHSETRAVEAAGMTAIQIPIEAGLFGSAPPTEEQIRMFFALALDPAKQPVFFHCAQGVDRTGTFAALWRIEIDGWTPTEAIEEMQAFGYHDYYVDLIDFVRDYEPRGLERPKRNEAK